VIALQLPGGLEHCCGIAQPPIVTPLPHGPSRGDALGELSKGCLKVIERRQNHGEPGHGVEKQRSVIHLGGFRYMPPVGGSPQRGTETTRDRMSPLGRHLASLSLRQGIRCQIRQ
jgi:hypothetical protein